MSHPQRTARTPLTLALGLALLGGAPAWAAGDYLLELGNEKGQFRSLTVSGVNLAGSPLGRGCRGASGPGEFAFSRPPAGLVALAAAPRPQHFPKATLRVRKSGEASHIELENVLITSLAGGSTGGARPMKLSFARANWTANTCLAAR